MKSLKFADSVAPWKTRVLGAFLFGCLIWLVLPEVVVSYDDDFAYLRSVVETIQRGRPWTYEWLTPWAASLSVLVAGLFKVTGSMSFAVHFSLALAAAMAFYGLTAILQKHDIKGWRSALLSLLILCVPSVFFMHLMFTSVALYMGCLWICAWLGMERRWGWFFVFWFIGISSRQSAITWLALPGWVVLTDVWKHRKLRYRESSVIRPLLVQVAGIITVVGLMLGMNKTSGQQTTFSGMSSFFNTARLLPPLAMGMGALVAGLGLGGLADFLRPQRFRKKWKSGHWLLAVALGAGGAFAGLAFREWVSASHSCYRDDISHAYFATLGALSGVGLLMIPKRPRGETLIVALGAFALLLIYGGVFDYYYNDLLFWGFLTTLAPLPLTIEEGLHLSLAPGLKATLVAAILFVMGVNLRWVIRFRYEGDRAAAIIRLYETALRSGKVTPDIIGQDTFGHYGWLMEDYHRAHDHSPHYSLGEFMSYGQNWDGKTGTGIESELSKKLRKFREWLPSHNSTALVKSDRKTILHQLEAPALWGRYTVRYAVARVPRRQDEGPPQLPFEPKEYRLNLFPLSDAEWRDYIEGKLLTNTSKLPPR